MPSRRRSQPGGGFLLRQRNAEATRWACQLLVRHDRGARRLRDVCKQELQSNL